MRNTVVPLQFTGVFNPLHLRTLVVVIESGSFAEAARQLGYTSSAVSQHISALEKSIKVTLFERSHRSVRPTPVAALLSRRAREQLSSLRQLEDEIAFMSDGQVGILRMGSFPTASKQLLPSVLAELHGEYPGLELFLDEGEPSQLIRLMLEAALDIALVYHYDLVPGNWPESLQRRPLFSEEISLIVPSGHQLASRETIDVKDLANEAWISTRADTAGATCFRRVCAQNGYEPHVVMRSNDYDVVTRLVQAGLGIAAVPALSLNLIPGVVRRAVNGLNVRRYSTALHRPMQFNPAIRNALSSIDSAVRQIAAEVEGVTLGSPHGTPTTVSEGG